MNKNNGMLKCMELEHIKKRTQLKLKNNLCNKICAREDKHQPTGQSTRLLHATPDAALTTIARRNIGTSTVTATMTAITIVIAIAIAPMTTNAKRQSALVLSALAITTGRMTVVTISLKT
jgi:hypothetical protein